MSSSGSKYGNLSAEENLEISVRAQRMALGLLAESVASLFDEKARAALQERLNHWAKEADMQGGEPMYGETAALLRVMAVRVSECDQNHVQRERTGEH